MLDPITFYEIRYRENNGRAKIFLTTSFIEVKIKTSEVLEQNAMAEIVFAKRTGPRESFIKALKAATETGFVC